MNNKQIKAARKLALEFTVIVAGVFFALAAESWWSEREHRQFEREIREDMIVEFESNLRILDNDIATNEEARLRIGMLEGLTKEELMALPDTHISEELSPGISWAGFDPELGSAQAFVESGNVIEIGSRNFRILMARWAGLLEMRRRFNLQAVDFQQKEILPVIARSGADDIWSFSERRELQYLLGNLYRLQEVVLQNQYELREAAQDLLILLREER
jgi:hypothetical protein